MSYQFIGKFGFKMTTGLSTPAEIQVVQYFEEELGEKFFKKKQNWVLRPKQLSILTSICRDAL
jgi:hypothetical protein